MLKKDFNKLKVDQRVVVSGKMDEKTFEVESGVISEADEYGKMVRFDDWTDGHGKDGRHWWFNNEQSKSFTITPENPEPAKATKKKPHGTQEYRGNGKHDWETVVDEIFHSGPRRTLRLRVPGGWLYRYESGSFTKSMVFVPVPDAVGYAV